MSRSASDLFHERIDECHAKLDSGLFDKFIDSTSMNPGLSPRLVKNMSSFIAGDKGDKLKLPRVVSTEQLLKGKERRERQRRKKTEHSPTTIEYAAQFIKNSYINIPLSQFKDADLRDVNLVILPDLINLVNVDTLLSRERKCLPIVSVCFAFAFIFVLIFISLSI